MYDVDERGDWNAGIVDIFLKKTRTKMVLRMCTMVEGRQENNWLLILQQLENNGCKIKRESMDNRVPEESQEICIFVNEEIFWGTTHESVYWMSR